MIVNMQTIVQTLKQNEQTIDSNLSYISNRKISTVLVLISPFTSKTTERLIKVSLKGSEGTDY